MSLGPVRYPEILKKSLSENTVELLIKIPENLAYFEGHFPGISIVPGVVQLHWAVKFATEHFKIPGTISQGNRIKFTQLMRSADEICLSLQYVPEKQMVSYSYKAGDQSYASGSFIYLTHGSNV